MSDKRNTIGQYSEAPYWCDRAKQAEKECGEWRHKFEVTDRALKNTNFDLLNICSMLIDFGGEEALCSRYDLDKLSDIRERRKQAELEISVENNDKT